MQKISKESLEDATNFLLQQLEQRLTNLEEKSAEQECVIKGIKKDRKLAHIITKANAKDLPQEEESSDGPLSEKLRDYIRSQYPEPSGYIKDEDLLRPSLNQGRNQPQVDIVHLLSNSLLDQSVTKQSPVADEKKLWRDRSPYNAKRSEMETQEVARFKIEEESPQSGQDVRGTFSTRVSANQKNTARGLEANLKVQPYTKWTGTRGILSTTKVLKGLRGSGRGFRDA